MCTLIRALKLSMLSLFVFGGAACRQPVRQSAEATRSALVVAARAGEGEALWRELPVSFTRDLSMSLNRIRTLSSPQLREEAAALMREAAEVLRAHAERFEQSAVVRERIAADRRPGLRRALEAAARKLAGSDTASSVDELGPALAAVAWPLLEARRSPLVAGFLTNGGRFADLGPGRKTFTYTNDGVTRTESWVQVEGRWIPDSWVTAWRTLLASSRPLTDEGGSLRAHDAQLVRLMKLTRARLVELRVSRDQAQFDSALSRFGGALSLVFAWATTSPVVTAFEAGSSVRPGM